MPFWILEPDPGAELGPSTELDRSVHPPGVKKLHLLLVYLPLDTIIESFPAFAIDSSMAQLASQREWTGMTLARARVEASSELARRTNCVLPSFVWLQVTGQAGVDDFGISTDHRLVVSGDVLCSLRSRRLERCVIELFDPAG